MGRAFFGSGNIGKVDFGIGIAKTDSTVTVT
jgi:hypothetical protein